MNKIMHGDVLEVLKTLPDESVDCIITSPPYYGLRDYGTAKWEGGDEGCDHLAPTGGRNPENAKISMGSGGINNIQFKVICKKCGAKRIDQQIGLEKTLDEYLNKMLLVTAELKRVLKKTGTMWLNWGDCYGGNISAPNQPKLGKRDPYKDFTDEQRSRGALPKCMMLQNYRMAIRMTDEQGWILRNTIIWHKPNCMPSSVKDRFTVDYEPVFFFSKSKKYWFETQYEQLENPDRTNFQSGKRTFGENKDRNDNDLGDRSKDFSFPLGRNKRCVWKIPTAPFKEAHFATFPEKLIEPMVKAGCPVGGICLDPFFGAGTTGVVAKKLGRNYLGIELNPEYIKIAHKRLDGTPTPLL
jgi:DNA modification methylase